MQDIVYKKMSAEEFKAKQKELGWTNEECAEKINCSVELVSKYRSGVCVIPWYRILLMEAAQCHT